MPRDPSPPSSRQRLQKILASAGIASRRAAEDLVRAGRVSVNGRTAELGESADPEVDVVSLDGVPVRREAFEYWLAHKPRGWVTTVSDPHGRTTVMELVPGRRGRVFPVGRLDLDTEGLVLLTNDGALAHALLHPSHEVEREYQVRVQGRVTEQSLVRLAQGIELDDGWTAPARVERVDFEADTTRFHLILIEGRKRQIRRACGALGHPVVRLLRVRMGPLKLGDLAPGAARLLENTERRALLRLRDAGAR